MLPSKQPQNLSKSDEDRVINETKRAVVKRVGDPGSQDSGSWFDMFKSSSVSLVKKENGSPEQRARDLAEKKATEEREASEKEKRKKKYEADKLARDKALTSNLIYYIY